MSLWPFIARQLARPQGIFGRLFMGRLLDRANAADNRLVYDTLKPDADARVLEIGFGGGSLLFEIARRLESGRIDGIDISPEMLAAADKKMLGMGLSDSIGLHLGGVDALPFTDASFDCACSVHTVYFWPDLQRGISELARVIKPGGRLVLGFSSVEAIAENGLTDRGFKAFSAEQIEAAYLAHGFEPDRLNTIERKGAGKICAYRGIRSL
ncbi:MAG: class I SAM-dependent methyltransferase [Gammaproteobacteria bacterium]|nr:class I SAM-dependent methyltransferase [Gammaproteobacteria bacterium]